MISNFHQIGPPGWRKNHSARVVRMICDNWGLDHSSNGPGPGSNSNIGAGAEESGKPGIAIPTRALIERTGGGLPDRPAGAIVRAGPTGRPAPCAGRKPFEAVRRVPPDHLAIGRTD